MKLLPPGRYILRVCVYYAIKYVAKALDLREERGARISQRRGPLGRRIINMNIHISQNSLIVGVPER